MTDKTTLGKQLKRLTDDSSRLLGMAKSGQFAVDPDAARRIADAYAELQTSAEWIYAGIYAASPPPKLGTSPYAQRIADYQREAARSLGDAVRGLKEVCARCEEAYRHAGNSYQDMDESSGQQFTGKG